MMDHHAARHYSGFKHVLLMKPNNFALHNQRKLFV